MAKTKTAGKGRASEMARKTTGKAAAKSAVRPAAKGRTRKAAGGNGRDIAATLEVGKRLVALCREMKNLEAVATLYSPKIVSIETHGDEHMPARMQGIDAIRGKNQWWFDNHEVHGAEADGPWPHGDRFIVRHRMDVTPKVGPFAGKRIQFEEAALYTVQDGKIVQEEFFYHMGG